VNNQLVFARFENDTISIWMLDYQNDKEILLAGDASENYAPSWALDGEWISYQSNLTTLNSQIWVMDQDGQNKPQITNLGGMGAWASLVA